MKLICERDALAAALSVAGRRVEHKSKIPILQHVRLDAAENKLSLTATNLDTRCVVTCPAEVSKADGTTVPADRLSRLVDGMPKGAQVSLEMIGTDLNVVCGRSRYKLQTLPIEDFPEMSEPTGGVEIILKSADAKRLFAEPAEAIPNNEQRIYFTGAFLSQGDKGLLMTGCDGIRLVRVAVANNAKLGRGYIIHRASMAEIAKLAADGDILLRCNDNLIEATRGNVVFTSKLVDATYPDTDRVIPKPSANYIQVERSDFIAALKRLVGVEDEHSAITIRWKAGEQTLELSSKGAGSGSEELSCECDLKDGEIAFNNHILAGMVDVIRGSTMQLHITDPGSPVLLLDPEDGALTVVAMPRRA